MFTHMPIGEAQVQKRSSKMLMVALELSLSFMGTSLISGPQNIVEATADLALTLPRSVRYKQLPSISLSLTFLTGKMIGLDETLAETPFSSKNANF